MVRYLSCLCQVFGFTFLKANNYLRYTNRIGFYPGYNSPWYLKRLLQFNIAAINNRLHTSSQSLQFVVPTYCAYFNLFVINGHSIQFASKRLTSNTRSFISYWTSLYYVCYRFEYYQYICERFHHWSINREIVQL